MRVDIYTDGACSSNGTAQAKAGYAFVILIDNIEVRGGRGRVADDKATNNVAELLAVIKGMTCIDNMNLSPINLTINIYSDSAYIVNCINQKWYEKWKNNGWKTSNRTPVLNQELWEELLELTDKFPLAKFIKVKGHSGNKYNEKADFLARSAIGG